MTEFKSGALIALRVRDFRLFWCGLVAQIGGQQMFQFTLGWLAFEITGSQAQLAVIHLCAFVPQFALTLLGGVLADRAELWPLAGASFLLGITNAIDEPSRSALFPRLLPRSHLRSGVPLISMAFGGSRIVAPSIAGFVIAAAGASASFLVSAIGISSMIAILFLVRPGAGAAPSHGSL